VAANSWAGPNLEMRLLQPIVSSLAPPYVAPPGTNGGWTAHQDASSVTVLDCGGGSGRLAVPVAQMGAHVTVVDTSVDALAALARRADEGGVANRVTAVQGDLELLAEAIGEQRFDLALLHGVLNVVDPRVTLAAVYAALRPGGIASLVIANPVAAIIARVLSGDLEAALADLESSTTGGLLDADAIIGICGEVGFNVEATTGVGVFAELISASSTLTRTTSGDSVVGLAIELERLTRTVSPYREIASRLHLLARRAEADG
jgi:S-adenosylmethionine-dependent methyltransferase